MPDAPEVAEARDQAQPQAAPTYARWLVPFLLAVYLVIALGHFDPIRWNFRPEFFPLGPLSLFWRVPDQPPITDKLREIRGQTP